jgi:hypothetical protein
MPSDASDRSVVIVPEPPHAAACASCVRPLVWLYHANSQRWISFATDSQDRDTIHVHRCRRNREDTDWRTLRPVPPEKIRAGAAFVRRAMGWTKPAPPPPRPAWSEPTRALSIVATHTDPRGTNPEGTNE